MRRPRTSSLPQAHVPGHVRNQSSADAYYEDVDPRFVAPETETARQTPITQSSAAVPPSLMPGTTQAPSSHPHPPRPIEPIDPNSSYEELQDGQMSPASDMTSISQRGVNPNWRPGMEGAGGQRSGQTSLGVPGRRDQRQQQQQQRDILLSSNPDFELPVGSGPHGRIPAGIGGQQGQAF